MTDKNGDPISGIDECDIYAVWYDRAALHIETGKNYLDDSDVFTSPYILGLAKINKLEPSVGDTMERFEIPFSYNRNYLADEVLGFGYNLAIVMSSSKNGGAFVGAVGSRLIVDYLTVENK